MQFNDANQLITGRRDPQLAFHKEYVPALPYSSTLEKTHVSGPQHVLLADGLAAVGLVATDNIPAFSMVLSGPTCLVDRVQWIEWKNHGNYPAIWHVPVAGDTHVFIDERLNNMPLTKEGNCAGNPVIPELMPRSVFDDDWQNEVDGKMQRCLPKWVVLQQGWCEFGKFPNIEPVVVRNMFNQYSIQYMSWSNPIRKGEVLYCDLKKIHGAYLKEHPMYPQLYTPKIYDMIAGLHEEAMRVHNSMWFAAPVPVANSDLGEPVDLDVIQEVAEADSDEEEAFGIHASMPWLVDYDEEGNPVSMY